MATDNVSFICGKALTKLHYVKMSIYISKHKQPNLTLEKLKVTYFI